MNCIAYALNNLSFYYFLLACFSIDCWKKYFGIDKHFFILDAYVS